MEQAFLQQLISATIWKNKAEQVYLERTSSPICDLSSAPDREIILTVSDQDIERFKSDTNRGPIAGTIMLRIADKAIQSWSESSTAPGEMRSIVKVYYSTNRAATGLRAAEKAFSGVRSNNISYGSVAVSLKHSRKMDTVRSPAILRLEGATNIDDAHLVGEINALTLEAWKNQIRLNATGYEKPGVLLFIHGYSNSFATAAKRSAQLAYDLAFTGTTVFFAWPSDDSFKNYLTDGTDAENSQVALAAVLASLADSTDGGPIYIVAHSMGNRVMMRGLDRFIRSAPTKRALFREVVMAAPDEDQDTFRLNFAPVLLGSGAPRFTLYASKHDLALKLSQWPLLNGGKRLGFGGPDLFRIVGMDSIDASSVASEFFSLGHSYFGDKGTVLADLFYLIRKGDPPNLRPTVRAISGSPVAWEILR